MAVVTTPIGSTPTILSPPPQAPAQASAGYFSSRIVPLQQDSKPESAEINGEQDAESLFSAKLVSPAVAAALPHDYTLRPLRRNDFALGFLDVLRVLTTVGDVSQTEFEHRFDEMKAGGSGGYHILVIVDGANKIVGTGALMVEKKFIHQLGHVGHIEDIAVAKDQQGKKLGLRLIQALDYVAEHIGCYKTILDCSEANEGFYVKCGFKRAGLEMAHYYGRD